MTSGMPRKVTPLMHGCFMAAFRTPSLWAKDVIKVACLGTPRGPPCRPHLLLGWVVHLELRLQTDRL